MSNLPHLLLHNNGVTFSLAVFPAAHHSSSPCFSSTRVSPSLHRQRSPKLFPLILYGQRKKGQPILCTVARERQASHGKHARRSTPSHGKPTSFGHVKVKKTVNTRKEAGIEEAKPGSSKPSEDCIARLFEEQPVRLHNNAATFQCAPQEPNFLTRKARRLDREKFLLYANGSSQISSFKGDTKLKPDFSTKLLDILSSFKRDSQLNDVKSRAVQPFEKNLGEAAMQRSPQSKVFISSGLQNSVVSEMERQSEVMDVTSNKGTQHVFPIKDEGDYSQLDPSRENILDSSWISKNTPQGDQLALEESDFSSESSDDEVYNEVEIMQGIPKPGNVSLQHASGLSEGNGRLQSDSLSPVSSKGWSYVSPRHLSRSTGSRSSPSKSSIPGLRSKYSKPDPKANQQSRLIYTAKPLHVLSNPEMKTEKIKEEDEEDDVTLTTFQRVHEQADKKLEEHINFDWWDSDEKDERPSDSMPNSKVETKSLNISRFKGEAKTHGTSRHFEKSRKQAETKSEECVSFDWSDSDADGDLRAEENSMFESDSDADSNPRAEENSIFEWSDSDAEDNVGIKNGLLSATSERPISFGLKGHSTWPNKENMATSSLGPSVDQASTRHNRDECQNSGLRTYYDHSSFLVANQNVDHDGLHQLPASVKFVEAPPWKSQTYPDFPFEINFSYSETPKAPILGFRDHFSPFGPETMERPWTGGAHIKPRRHLQAIQSFDPAIERKKAFELTFNRKNPAQNIVKSRKNILGKPLTQDEINYFVQKCHGENRHVSLGRDGLTHNMLHLIHTHWKRRSLCKIKCRGVPTLDMDNVCFHVEDKTGGQVVYRSGGVLYVFRGRNYRYQRRPVVPFMLYRPASPVYPKLVPQAPAGLTIEEACQLRILGQKVKPLLKLRKNSVLLDLVGDVRDAFKVDDLVSLDYEGLKPSDYRKLGAKLRELVPCVLLSFRNHRIVLWKGRDWRLSSIHNREFCVDSAKLTAEPSLEVTTEGTCLSASETKLKGSGNVIPVSEPAAVCIQSVDDSISPVFKEESTRLQHMDKLDSLRENDLTDSSALEEHSQTGVQPHKAARDLMIVAENDNLRASNSRGKIFPKTLLEQQLVDEVNALSDVPTLSEDLPLKWNEHTQNCADDEGSKDAACDTNYNETPFPVTSETPFPVTSETSYNDTPLPVYGTANYSYDEHKDPTIPPGVSQWNHLDGGLGSISNFPFGNLDAIWEVALKDGMAVKLEGVDLEADLVLQIASVFSEVAPAGPEYTDKLVNRLRLRGVYGKTPKRFVVPLHAASHENLSKKKRISKRASPAIVIPPSNALETDALAKILFK